MAGPAQLSSFHCLFHISFLHHYHPGPACHCDRYCRGSTPPSPCSLLSLTTSTLHHSSSAEPPPHLPFHHKGPACHCGWSRPTLLISLPFPHFLPSSLPPRPGLSLWQVPPRFHPALTWLFLSLTTPTLPLSHLSLVATPRAPAAMGDPTVILLTLCHNESTSDSLGNMLFDDYKFAFTGESGGASLPRTWTTSTDITWLCFVLDGPWTSWRVTTSLSSSFTTPSWTEWILRGLWNAHRCFTSSHQDQWWALSTSWHSNCFTRMILSLYCHT